MHGTINPKFGSLVSEGAVGDNNVLIAAICVHCVVTDAAHLELAGSFWVETRAVPIDLLPHAIVSCLQSKP